MLRHPGAPFYAMGCAGAAIPCVTEFKGLTSLRVDNDCQEPGSKVMSRSTAVLLAASLALLGVAGIAHADTVYEWTDAHGEVHYSDQWVPGAKVITTATAHAQADAASQGIRNESEAADNQLKEQQDARAVQQDEAKARAAQCTQDKEQYQRLIQSRRVYTVDKKSGERHYLSDAEADAERLKARQAMEADCGTGS